MEDSAGLIVLVGRILIAVFFVVAGSRHITQSQAMSAFAASINFPGAAIAGWPTGAWIIAGALSLGLGIWPDLGALMIALFLLIALSYFHRFWTADESQRFLQETQFWRNVVGIGACLIIFGTFTTLGENLRYTITEPLFSL